MIGQVGLGGSGGVPPLVVDRAVGSRNPLAIWDWLMLSCKPLFKNSFSKVSRPTSRSSFSILSFRAASSVGSLNN